MIILLIFGILSSIISGIGKAIRDTLAHHFERSIFKDLNPLFWNPVLSGNNKWKNGDRNQGEKFFLSTTLWVSLTEGWHIGETINVLFLVLGVGLMTYSIGLWGAIIARIIYGISFTIAYKKFEINPT